jgi:hypothetical protein
VTGRRRATVFAIGALTFAGLAITAAGGAGSTPVGDLGALRPVLVTRSELPAGAEIDRGLARGLDVRQVPAAVAPPDALLAPGEALGRRLATTLPAGAYVTASDFRLPSAETDRGGRRPAGTTPVELTVTGASAIGGARPGTQVDVVVTGEPGPGGGVGRTWVAAERVPLLALRRGGPGLGGGESWIASVALRRDQAIRLIRAENFAREIRLLAR